MHLIIKQLCEVDTTIIKLIHKKTKAHTESNLLIVTQQVIGRAKIWTQGIWLQSLSHKSLCRGTWLKFKESDTITADFYSRAGASEKPWRETPSRTGEGRCGCHMDSPRATVPVMASDSDRGAGLGWGAGCMQHSLECQQGSCRPLLGCDCHCGLWLWTCKSHLVLSPSW